jgi:hypothetical protein
MSHFLDLFDIIRNQLFPGVPRRIPVHLCINPYRGRYGDYVKSPKKSRESLWVLAIRASRRDS